MNKPAVAPSYPWIKLSLEYWLNDVRIRALMLSNKKFLAYIGLHLLAAKCAKGGKLEVDEYSLTPSDISTALLDMIKVKMSTDEMTDFIAELMNKKLIASNDTGTFFLPDFISQQPWIGKREQDQHRQQKHRERQKASITP